MADFEPVFQTLRAILEPYAEEMEVNADTPTEYGLQTHWRRPEDGYPGYFGSVRRGKRYVSFHLMPVYAFPNLLEDVSPDLLRRMQGKSCFNFTRTDDALFSELRALTQRGYEAYASAGRLDDGGR